MGNKRIYLGREVSKYAEIAGGAIITITSLFFVLMVMGFEITGTDDMCLGTLDDPCVSYGKICNLGPDNYDIYNPEQVKIDFSPSVPNSWIFFKDGRVKKEFLHGIGVNHSTAGWRYENFTDATKPRSDRVYVHRFARYSCQEYMLVGLKENQDDVIKWGMGVGAEYYDPFWYGVNTTAETLVSDNLSVELETPINITTNITGAATVCVDIDHPEYGDNYTCGTPNANFTFDIDYFRKTEFADGESVETMDSAWTRFNGTTYSGGAYGTSAPKEWCEEYFLTIPDSRKLRVSYYVYSWQQGIDYYSDVPVDPQITIRDSDRELLETIIDTDYAENVSAYSYVISDNFYTSGLYGFCVKMPFILRQPQTNDTVVSHPNQAGWGLKKTIDVDYNYYINYSSSYISSNTAFCQNAAKHVYRYKDGNNATVEESGLCIESGTYTFENPNQDKTVDLIEIWLYTGTSASAGLTEQDTIVMFLSQGGGFSARNSEERNTYTVTGDFLTKGPDIDTYVQNDSTFYVSAHQYDEVQDLSINVTGIEIANDVGIYVNGILLKSLGFIYNTSEGNISETESTEFNLVSGNSTTFSIPKGATVTNTTMNFTGSNVTWETSEELIPETWSSSYGSPSPALPTGTQSWYGPVGNAIDGNLISSSGPWIDGPTYWDVEWLAYIYENYTKDTDAHVGNWSSAYICSPNDDITFDTDCWSGSAWVEVFSKTGTNCGSYQYEIFELPAACVSQTILQIKNTLQYGDIGHGTVQRASYHEGKVNYYRTSSPKNLTIEVGVADGTPEYEGSGELTGSNSTTAFVSAINNYLQSCAEDDNGNCDVPIYFNSDDGGILTIDRFEVLYTYDPNPISLDATIIQEFLDESTNEVNIPIYFSIDEGSFNVSALAYDYRGGNDTIEIVTFEQGNTSNNETLNLFVYYSNFIKELPYTWANKIFFMPRTNSSKNVTAYGQTSTKPAYNISTKNYGGNLNLSIKVNESFSCLNITWSTDNTKSENRINSTWQNLAQDLEYLNNTNIWLWADFENCDASDQRILQPYLEIEGYCVECLWI